MTLIYTIVLIGVLVFVHEFGHFIFAKLLGVKILKFSLGFGPKIIGKTFGETQYLVSAVPLGGYVKMLGEEPGEELEESEKKRAYSFQPVWKRFTIVFLGPIFNIFFAAFLFVLVFIAGVPARYPDVGKITPNSPAEKAGLKFEDRILAMNGQGIETWNDIDAFFDKNQGNNFLLKVRRGGEIIELSVKPERKIEKNIFGAQNEIWDIGVFPLTYPIIGEVLKGSPAEKAGLKKGDRIIDIEGKPILTWEDMTQIVYASPEKRLNFQINRDGGIFFRSIVPEKKNIDSPGGEQTVGLIGIKQEGHFFTKSFGIGEALYLGIRKTWEVCILTVLILIKLIQRVIPANTIGGPILIFQMAGEQAAQGALNFITFMAGLSINLGIFNLLPIPLLDGGHLMFLGIEAIRKQPFSEKVMINAQKIGLAFIITLIVFVFYNDILRLITGKIFP
jgi:regulator of sigma E protease